MNKNKVIPIISGFLISTSLTCAVEANPVINNVGSGNVTIHQSGNTETINQTSQQAILNWNSFNIGGNQATHFVQPTGGVALNRISPTQGASQIYGELTATGQIILINPAGIYFGPHSVVNVGGLIATTSGISDKNFLAGKYIFDQPTSYTGATILNEGQIIAADHGLVALVGPNVTNNGMIKADLGKVVLASGDAFTVSFDPGDMINFTVTKPTSQHGSVNNNGKLIANGGEILVTATQASSVLDNTINMNGVAMARSFATHHGQIILTGQGTVNVGGRLISSSRHYAHYYFHRHRSSGGSIEIAGKNINILNSAVLDTNGDLGGGNIIISGNNSANVASGAALLANALSNGNGGTISITSNGNTNVYGTLSVMGGPQSGNGGLIETSGPVLDVNGISINASAPAGSNGSWVLDPTTLDIEDNGGNNSNVNSSSGTYIGDNNSNISILDVSILENELGVANVTIETTGGGSGSGSGDINVESNITWSSNNSLTISAFRDLHLDAQISNTLGNGALTLIANNAIGGTPYDIDSGYGIVYQNVANSINVNGPVTIYTNPLNSNYSVATYANEVVANSPSIWLYVNDANDLNYLSNASSAWDSQFLLNADISNAGTLNSGIGNYSEPFLGTFNGNNHTINDLCIYQPMNDYIGVFGGLVGTVENLSLTNVDIHGDDSVGAIAGISAGYIFNVNVTGNVYGHGSDIGGIVGDNYAGEISYTNNAANIHSSNHAENIGGLAGYSFFGSINNSSNSGNIYAGKSNQYVGGLIGSNYLSDFENNFNLGSIYTKSHSDITSYVGGLIGFNIGDIYSSYNSGNIIIGSATNSFLIGGLVGDDEGGDIINSYNSGNINTHFTVNGSYNIGGLAGSLEGDIINSYNRGTINIGPSIYYDYGEEPGHYVGIGGLAGYLEGSITNSYNAGNLFVASPLDGDMYDIGGLVGYYNYGTINGSHNNGSINISGGSNYTYDIGGLVGIGYQGIINQSYNVGNIIMGYSYGGNGYTGGLLGYSDGVGINQSFSLGSINVGPAVDGDDEEIGGLVGEMDDGYILNSFSRSPIYIATSLDPNGYIGGLVGYLYNSQVTNAYSAAPLVLQNPGNSYAVGGLIGFNQNSSVIHSYWDKQASGWNMSAGGTGETTAAMMQQSTFINWDFKNIWGIYNGYTYPFLLAIPYDYPTPPIIPVTPVAELSVSNIIQQPDQQNWGPEEMLPLWLWLRLLETGNLKELLDAINNAGGLNNVTITCANTSCSSFTISAK